MTSKEVEKMIRELHNSQKKTDESMKEVHEAQKETERSFQSLQKTLRETRKETERSLQEAQKETERSFQSLQETQKETERSLQELHKTQANTEKELLKANGNFNNKWGTFMENLVRGDLNHLLQKRGIAIQGTSQNLIFENPDGSIGGEFDLLAHNGDELVVVEVKTSLTKNKVDAFMEKMKNFKKYFAIHRDKTIYAAVAFLEDTDNAAKYSEECGLFVIRAPGGNSQVSTITNNKEFKPKAF